MCADPGRGWAPHVVDGDHVGAMTSQVLALRNHLVGQQVSVVVMEATGDYWRPFYYLLEADFQVMLVNARTKNQRGSPQPSSPRDGGPDQHRSRSA